MKNKIFKVLTIGLLLVCLTMMTMGAPTGTNIVSNVTDYGSTSPPSNRTDPGGSINTLVVDAIQQDQQWKAYIGNISGSLTLDDSSGNTIYQWSLDASEVSGEIFASRSNSVTWSNINCSSLATIQGEQTALSITDTVVDSIKNTFNFTIHPPMVVAGRSIAQNSCNATSTFVSSTRENQATATFPEILLHDETNLVYATNINQDSIGYTGDIFDFQLIVADNPTVVSTTYYFYAEIGS